MEYLCHQCRQAVQEGTPFCSHCGAPQIRVVLPEGRMPATSPAGDAVPVPLSDGVPGTPPIFLPVRLPGLVRSSGLAALISAVLIILGLYKLVAVLGAGFMAVLFYRQRNPTVAIRPGMGARLGALAGLFVFAIALVVGTLQVAVLHKAPEVRNFLLEQIHQTELRYPDPQYQPGIEAMKSPAGIVLLMVMFVFFAMVLFVVIGMVGGAMAGAVLGRAGDT